MERLSFTLAAALGGAMLAGTSSLAYAQTPQRMVPPQGLGELLGFGPQPARTASPPVARYIADGGQEFTFDRMSVPPRVRFSDSREIVVLQPQPAPRGDVIYLNDVGEPVLRVSGLGGMTLFTPQRPQGAPVAFVAMAPSIQLETIRAGDLLYRMGWASDRMTRLIGRQVGFEAADISPESASLLADVVNLTLLAYQKNAASKRAKEATMRVGVIMIMEGKEPSARLAGDTLNITIAAGKGVAGRPSSERIARALGR